MLKQSESELNQLVKIAWELGLAVGNCSPGDEDAVMFNAISAHLHATGWSRHDGAWNGNVANPKITWTQYACSPLFPRTIPWQKINSPCVELIESTLERNAATSTVVACASDADGSGECQWQVLCLTAYPHGRLACVAFVRPLYADAFNELEIAFIEAMLANLNAASASATNDCKQTVKKTGLPKRQREVLEFLLKGASLKEIAAHLRISRHTVNDYSKALYRHFGVAGRAELAARFRNSAMLELVSAE